MTDNEKRLLVTLIWMVEQHLRRYDDEVDSIAETAGQRAIETLAGFGLMEVVDTRFGRWTEAGKRFRREEAEIRAPELITYLGQIRLVGKSEPEN